MTMFYKAIGFLVWKAARFYVSNKLPPRKVLAGGVLALAAATLVATVSAKRNGD
jgi:hypothetical protein